MCSARAQPFFVLSGNNYGVRAGIVLSLGTHVNRAGLFAGLFYVQGPVQLSAVLRANYNLRDLGPPKKHGSLVISPGILFGFGKSFADSTRVHSPLSNQTGLSWGIGYVYNAYFNRIGTRQQTSILHLVYREFSLATENDLLARPALDRFRTGAIQIAWKAAEHTELALSCKLWTGQYRKKAYTTPSADLPNGCYMDTTGGTFTGFSHGILALQARYATPYAGNVQAATGIDAEQVRHAVQNRLLHAPKGNNCYMPMIDRYGGPYLFDSTQRVRPPRPFFEAALNPATFY